MENLIKIAKNEVGYLEKSWDAYYKDKFVLDLKTEGAGKENVTKYWRDIGPDLQGSAWCQCFINWLFTLRYGLDKAKEVLCSPPSWSFYTPTCAGYFKKAGRWYTVPKVGDIIYFQNEERIHHVGLVESISGDYVNTIEGNTSGSSYSANGGCVARHSYKMNDWKIAGYGRPIYEVIHALGWHEDEKGWRYAEDTETYVHSEWRLINSSWYYFGADGYAYTGFHEITRDDGTIERYYFEDKKGSPKECALLKTNDRGALVPWIIS